MSPLRPLAGLLVALVAAPAAELAADPNVRAALDRISAASMRGHLSFLASDLLEGRGTPSRGLDIAAEYIAAQYRRAGLEPMGDDGYFQTARFSTFEPQKEGLKFELEGDGKQAAPPADQVTTATTSAVSLSATPVLRLTAADAEKAAQWKHDDVKDKAIAIHFRSNFDREGFRLYSTVRRLRPALLILTGSAARGRRTQLVAQDARESETPVITLGEGDAAKLLEETDGLKISVTIPAPKETAVTLRNVAGLLRGSDPVLKDSYILVTGHYDHMGIRPTGDGDRIFNGANDDASGTVSVMEIAAALAGMSPKPKRSIVFVALFGEELGLLGSQYYGRHPLAPLVKTIANVNLEQVGRTDSSDGPQIAMGSFTGFDYSDMPALFERAGAQVGVKVYKDAKRSDPFFSRSDNQALADLGVPSHTLCVAFEFPDYHGLGDEWQKIDYDNMAKVDRMVALGVLMMADSDAPPRWNTTDAKAKKYSDAWNALHSEATH
ncbi:MAG: M28 family peptidase [Acidobacteria bacterium]|nr:M28 family peptidase [Acidobacteriota bacterium]